MVPDGFMPVVDLDISCVIAGVIELHSRLPASASDLQLDSEAGDCDSTIMLLVILAREAPCLHSTMYIINSVT